MIDKKKLHECIEKMRLGEKVEEEIYQEFHKLVYQIAFSILKNRENAEDVMQIVFTKLITIPKEQLPKEKESTWLYKVTKNETITYLRKEKRTVTMEEIYEIPDKNSEIEEILSQEKYQKLIQGLSKEEQEIVSLKIIAELPFREISKLLDMPMGTVQWKYYKATKALKLSLGNLTISLLAFLTFIITKQKKGSTTSKEELSKEENEESQIQEDHFKESTKDKELYNEIMEETIDNKETIELTLPIETIPLVISAIFLIVSITFFIIFQKHQQKSKKKTSKK